MTTPQSRPNGEPAPAPPVFSYAQAAKGRSGATTTSATQSHQSTASGISTPAKDSTSAINTPSAGSERGDRSVNGTLDALTKPDQAGGEVFTEEVKAPISTEPISTPTSPSFGTASTSTLPREEKNDDDDFTLVGPSETYRDRSSQNGSTSVEKSAEPAEGRRSKKGKKPKNTDKDSEKEKDKAEVKQEVLVPAPLPAVNFWQQRKEEFAKTKPVPVPGSQQSVESSKIDPLSAPGTKSIDAKKRSKGGNFEDTDKAIPTSQNGALNPLQPNRGLKKGADAAIKSKEDQSGKRAGPRGSRSIEKEDKPSYLPPPVDDAISWPTPETSLEEDRRKPQEKVEKDEKDDGNQNKPRQKWVPVPFVPTVSFNTPIPPRGGRGRGGARGGRTEGGRPRDTTNGPTQGERGQTSTEDVASPTDSERPSNSTTRAASLPPPKRQQNDQAGTRRPLAAPSGEKSRGPAFKNESGIVAEGRSSGMSHPEQSHEVLQDQKTFQNDIDKTSKPEQFQGNYQESLSRGSERRAEPITRGMDTFRDSGNAVKDNNHSSRDRVDGRADRGRGGFRGRGGHGNFPSHPQQNPFLSNGHGSQVPNGYPSRQNSAPYSPPLQSAPFSNQFVPVSRGRGGSRSQSIPNSAVYRQYGPSGGAISQHMSPLQTSNPMFDYQHMQPMSAAPYNSYVDEASVVQLVTMQLEYYFSIDNLCKDVFLRKHMDSQGFVFLSFIAGFKRIKALTTHFELLRYACQESDIIDVIQGEDGKDRIRRVEGWEKWIMAMEDRDESVRNAGPVQHLRSHPTPKFHQMAPMMMPGHHAMSPLSFSPNGAAPNFPPYGNGVLTMNGNGAYHAETPLSAAVAEFSPNPYPVNGHSDPLEAETSFQNEEVANLTLVFARPRYSDDQKPKLPYHNASSRTFSNGSIDGRSIAEELNDESRQGRPLSNGAHASET
jgi:la-related protein 1